MGLVELNYELLDQNILYGQMTFSWLFLFASKGSVTVSGSLINQGPENEGEGSHLSNKEKVLEKATVGSCSPNNDATALGISLIIFLFQL